MKRVAYWYWMIPSTAKPGKVVKSSHRMSEEIAQQRYPGCVKAPNQTEPEWRELPETPDEVRSHTNPFDPKKGF